MNPKQKHYLEKWAQRSNAIKIHSTYKDNPFIPEASKEHIEAYLPLENQYIETEVDLSKLKNLTYKALIKRLDLLKVKGEERRLIELAHKNEQDRTASAFDWQVYGLGLHAERPNRIYRFEEIPLREYLEKDIRPIYVVDWGIVDPFAVVEMFYYDGAIYCREINYKSENELKLALSSTQRLQYEGENEGFVTYMFTKIWKLPKNRPVICDTNRPLKIAALKKAGYDFALKAGKYPGSKLDAINIINGLKVFYTEDSQNIKYEQENYSRKVHRPTGEILEEPEDANDHTLDAIAYGVLFLVSQGVINP